jgi:hypothetical protein
LGYSTEEMAQGRPHIPTFPRNTRISLVTVRCQWRSVGTSSPTLSGKEFVSMDAAYINPVLIGGALSPVSVMSDVGLGFISESTKSD